MEINIFSNIHYTINRYGGEIKRARNMFREINDSDNDNYHSSEIEEIDETFEFLKHKVFTNEVFLYVSYVEIEPFKSIVNDLYYIEKKRNPYIEIETFKERVFVPMKHYIDMVLDNKRGSSLIWATNGNCFKTVEYLEGMRRDYYLICDSFLEYEDIIWDYFTALRNFIEDFTPTITEPKPQETQKVNRTNVAYKLEILKEIETLRWINNNISTKEKRYEILAEIIGCSPSTVKDYLTNKKAILKEHTDKAKDFVNSKRY